MPVCGIFRLPGLAYSSCKIMVPSAGCLVYHGPREQVVPFFESLGFRLPSRKGTADFLQEITSKKDQQVCPHLVPASYAWLSQQGSFPLCQSDDAALCLLIVCLSQIRKALLVGKRDVRSPSGVLDVGRHVQQYWPKEAGPYKFMPAAEMAKAFQNFRIGKAAAEELAQPPERTKQGILGFCLHRIAFLEAELTLSGFRKDCFK